MEEKPMMRFGNYELVRRIDIGGMGEVYLANQLSAFGRPVAIKIIRADLAHDITARARFLREAEVSSYLKHEHILPLYDFGEEENRLYLVTPYIDGGTLATYLKTRGALSIADTRKLFVPLVQAVAYIHRRGVIHRDLKPSNILLDSEDGEIYVRLIDFSIASVPGHNPHAPLTTAGHEVGTIAYMAPERLSGVAAPSNDIFSLGVILHQMLTARMPTALPASEGQPDPLLQVVQKCIAIDPAERYATAEDLLKSFELACQQALHKHSQRTPPVHETPTSLPILDVSAPSPQPLAAERSQPALLPELRPVEKVSLQHSGEIPALTRKGSTPVQIRPERFTADDYDAPTADLSQFRTQIGAHPARPSNSRPPQTVSRPGQHQTRKRRSSLPLLLALLSIALLLGVSGLLIYGYEIASAVSVTINFAPQQRVLSQIFELEADPRSQSITNTTIPARVLSLSQQKQQSAPTTGMIDCVDEVFNCQQGVSQADINNLFATIQPELEQSIMQSLQSKINALHGYQASQIAFSTPQVTANPAVNQPGKTVTVSVTEQGSVGYILETDLNKIVAQELAGAASQLGAGFQVIAASMQIGHPVVEGTNTSNGLLEIKVAAGAIVRYHFSTQQLMQISNGLVNKTYARALTYLRDQPGIDPTSIGIHFTSGNGTTMPGDTGHIQLVPLEPGTLPDVTLTPLPTTP
jgi:serine/threonine protein kinase